MPTSKSATGHSVRAELSAARSAAGSQGLVAAVVVIGALYFGRDIFVPMALAVLLAFVLSPFISLLRRIRIPRTLAVIAVVATAFLAILAFGFVIAGQVSQLGTDLPQYQSNIQQKIRALRSNASGDGIFQHASKMLDDLGEEIGGTAEPAPPARSIGPTETRQAEPDERRAEPEPLAVQIQQPEPEPLQLLQDMVGPLVEPMATGGIVIVFVIFMLLQREDLRDRFIRLAGAGDLHRTTRALSDAGRRVAKYLLMQLVVNATYGVPIGIGLWIIGVPNPLLWGMLAMVLRFVPYIGPVIAAMVPLALSVAVDPGWSMLVWTASLFVVLELVSNNIVEPWLYGSSTGLSPVAIIVAAIFWTWLWGPIGLLLSTPLTVCLVVLGQHVPQFGFLDVLLGSEPVLTPQESLYQRLLAGDPDEATERAEEFIETHSLLAFYDNVAIPALVLTEQDRARGVLDDERRADVAKGAFAIVDNFADDEPDASEGEAGTRQRDLGWETETVLSIGGRGNLDDAAAAMLAQILNKDAIGARVVSFEAVDQAKYVLLDLTGIRLICLSYMNADSLSHARFLVRRLRRRTTIPILVGFWSLDEEAVAGRDLAATTRADMAATSLGDALQQIRHCAGDRRLDGAAKIPAAPSRLNPGGGARPTQTVDARDGAMVVDA